MCAAAVPALTLGYSIYEGNRQRRQAKSAQDQVNAEANAQNAEYLAQQNRSRQLKAMQSMTLRKSLLRSASGAGNQGGTILTGPLGLSGDKTVLGA